MTRLDLPAVEEVSGRLSSAASACQLCIVVLESFMIVGKVSVVGSRCDQVMEGCAWERKLLWATTRELEVQSLILVRGRDIPPGLDYVFGPLFGGSTQEGQCWDSVYGLWSGAACFCQRVSLLVTCNFRVSGYPADFGLSVSLRQGLESEEDSL
uniref:Uncharacterized protein n=1 Tax=Photinus pyralis TaxID=7054 RepID=A0A1Y1L1A0_PHOPY